MRSLGRLISTTKIKKVNYVQEEFYCEQCNKTLSEETIYDKQKKIFICRECKKEKEI